MDTEIPTTTFIVIKMAIVLIQTACRHHRRMMSAGQHGNEEETSEIGILFPLGHHLQAIIRLTVEDPIAQKAVTARDHAILIGGHRCEIDLVDQILIPIFLVMELMGDGVMIGHPEIEMIDQKMIVAEEMTEMTDDSSGIGSITMSAAGADGRVAEVLSEIEVIEFENGSHWRGIETGTATAGERTVQSA